jgi:phytanoyl-CoA hydroxylase
MDTAARRKAWNEQGFVHAKGLISPTEAAALEAEVIDRIRADPPERHPDEAIYFAGPNYAIFPEKDPSPTAVEPEDYIAKVFNCHAEGLALDLARRPEIVERVAEILGPDLDCFQSQFILKNPGVIGQPWHQDSYYFAFDRQPQVGVWVALSRATLENGCLWVLPGSHENDILEHVPDRRPAANRGYLEIVSEDDSSRVPCLMEPGDVLFFHSYLLHMSTDNVAAERRSAMVYHYGRAGTKAVSDSASRALAHVNRWVPVRRADQAPFN